MNLVFMGICAEAVGIVTLPAGQSRDQFLVRTTFSIPVLGSTTVGTRSFPGVKRPGRGNDHPPSSNAKVKERVELYLDSNFVPSWRVRG
jgi:hypothetical protein